VGAAAQFVLQVAALWDLRRRSADELRGSKRWWTVAAFVNIVGPDRLLRRRPAPSGAQETRLVPALTGS
jgi:hypothetical protein